MTGTRTSRKATALWGAAALLVAASGVAVLQVPAVAAAVGISGGTSGSESCGTCAGNNGVGGGNGAGTGVPAKALQVSGSANALLAPGVGGTMTVRVTNPNTQDIVVTRVTAVTTSMRDPQTNPLLAACDPRWITFEPYAESTPPLVVKAKQTQPVPLTVRFANLPSNQDNCKAAEYAFDFTASARQVQR